jgi:hypothetical protein
MNKKANGMVIMVFLYYGDALEHPLHSISDHYHEEDTIDQKEIIDEQMVINDH